MSEQDSNQQDLHKDEVHEQVEHQTAATATEGTQAPPFSTSLTQSNAAPAASSSPLSGIDVQKLLGLIKNPSSALQLQPLTEWIYGAIGAAVGVLGFFFWIWAAQEQLANDLFGNIGNLIFLSVISFALPGKSLVIGIFSIALLVGSLTLIGNRLGARKRNWMEAVTYQGSTQLQFGVGWIVCGVVAFLSLQLSMLIGVILLLICLLVVVTQAEDLHEVSRERRFLFIVYSVAAYSFLLFLVYSIIT
ncbi:hypothetical protein [Cohnella sp. WQ 127256]|uniref:hypothetical protein n=1 Tax=Cohnella sp. WQ 127256 TaxID=2938790 RepID=UPI00211858AE|nr:hypothetical protein [Cohnella sp. WQ 127256]